MESEVNLDIIKETQDRLGKFVKKPPLTEKLLKKPPFRFLHDIITAVIKSTGFYEGLFEEDELISDNVKERDKKIAFLNKAISVLVLTTGSQLSVKPSKIVAGQEPEKTNEFLQLLGEALEKKLSSTNAIRTLKGENKTRRVQTVTKSTKKPTSDDKSLKSKSSEKISAKPSSEKIVAKPSKTKDSSKDKTETKVSKDAVKETQKTKTETRREKIVKSKDKLDTTFNVQIESEVQLDETKVQLEDTAEQLEELKEVNSNESFENHEKREDFSISNQKSDENNKESLETDQGLIESESTPSNHTLEEVKISEKESANSFPEIIKKEESVIQNESKILENNKDKEPIKQEKKISERPASVRPSSSRPGAPRVKDKHENVSVIADNLPTGIVNIIKETTHDEEEEESHILIIDEPADDINVDKLAQNNHQQQHGHLVQQILESQTGYLEKTTIEWEVDLNKTRENTNKEAEEVRFNIQTVSRLTNPIGKLLDHVQEDVEVMRQELEQWKSVYEEASKELAKQKSVSNEYLMPLRTKIKQLDADAMEKRAKINDLKVIIQKNSERINKLLTT